MNGQKIENILNLAFDSTQAEREKSLELDVGYNPISREWDVIVKYSGNLDEIRALGIRVVELTGGYAIMTLPEDMVERLSDFPQVEFIEKPKRLFFQDLIGNTESCVLQVRRAPFSLSGKGVLVAVIDSGIDYTLSDFRREDGSTRIRLLWDQTIEGRPPEGYLIGTEYTQEEINQALSLPTRQEQLAALPSRDVSGHGTAVAGVAAGNGRGGAGEQYQGVAPESELLIVKLGMPREEGFPRTTELMQAVDYAVKKALEFQMPVVINLSFGNTYGAHDGTSLLELFLTNIANVWKNVICIGTGNEGNAAGHVVGNVSADAQTVVPLAVQEGERAMNLQIWKAYQDEMDISLITPSGVQIGPIQEALGTQRFAVGGTEILLYYGEPSPFSINQEIFIDFLPTEQYISGGVWRIVLTPREIVTGQFAMWLPSETVLSPQTAFLTPSETGTNTIPSTAQRTIAVGAYDARTRSYADFSGRGQFGLGIRIRPDMVAPGVNVTAPVPGGTYAQFSGTSFATPFVTGGAALLMEWGIVNGNDPYLYGEKVRAYLIRGARKLPGFLEWPNNQAGWGALCVKDSLPL